MNEGFHLEEPSHHMEIILSSWVGATRTVSKGNGISDLSYLLPRYKRKMSPHIYPTLVNQPPNLSHHLSRGFQHFLESSEETGLVRLLPPLPAHVLLASS